MKLGDQTPPVQVPPQQLYRSYSVDQVIHHLEQAALGGHFYAMFNLGIVHLYGYTKKQNVKLAKDWFLASTLPEGFYAASMYYSSSRQEAKASDLRQQAQQLGFGSPW